MSSSLYRARCDAFNLLFGYGHQGQGILRGHYQMNKRIISEIG
jgi:hypothetical protein